MNIKDKICDFIGKSMLAALGAGSTIWAFTDAFDIEVNLLVIWLMAVFMSVLFEAIMHLKHKNLIIVIITLIVVMLVVIFHKYIGYGLDGIVNVIKIQYNEYFDVNTSDNFVLKKILEISGNKEFYNTLFLCVVLFEYIYILTIATFYKIYPSIHMIISGVVLVLIFVLGRFPGIIPTILLIYYFIVCAMHKKSQSIHLARTAVVGLAVAAGLGIMLLAVDINEYDGENQNKKYKRKIDDIAIQLHLGYRAGDDGYYSKEEFVSGATGGINGGKLGEVDKVNFSGKDMLKIYINSSGSPLYLKGFVANNYDGDKWKCLCSDQVTIYSNYINMYGLNADNSVNIDDYRYKSHVTDEQWRKYSYDCVDKDLKYVFYPYFSDIEYKEDYRYMYPYPGGEYRVTGYYEISFETALSCLKKNVNEMNLYMESSMQVPENVRECLDEIIPSDLRYDGTAESVRMCSNFIINYLAVNTSYSLSPGKLKKGEDFVVTFLTEKKKGYCTSYASASTLMFRYMGIPARYVEGFVVSPSEQRKGTQLESCRIVNVKDSDAHAWTEIYIEGLGFVPVETTPPYTQMNENQTQEPDTPNNDTPETSKKEQTTSRKESEKNTTKESEKVSEINKKNNNSSDNTLIVIFIAALFVGSIFIYLKKSGDGKFKYPDYKTENNRENIKALSEILSYELQKANVNCGKNINIEVTEKEITEVLEKMSQLLAEDDGKNDDKVKLPDAEMTKEFLWLLEKGKYADENVNFSDDEIANVSKYVEEFKNCLQYFKNRL